MKTLRPALAILASCLTGAGPAPAADRPNVVFLLADDLGYGDLGCTGHPYARTPTIDRLAREGTLFRNFYVGGATCSPSRTALMTGRFPATFKKAPATYGFDGAATVTELLKRGGYRTGHFGKWHIGDEQGAGTYGIDEVRVSGGNRRDPRGRDSVIADQVIDFLRSAKGRPFYANVWFHTVHNPVDPPRPFVDQFRDVAVKKADFANPDMAGKLAEYEKAGEDLSAEMRKHLGDVLQLDGQVARILQAIDDLGLREDTIVVFTGDNGPNKYGSAGPFRAGKHSLFDGGIHQPLIVRWPGRVKAGRVDGRSVLAGVDWLPTLCAIAGVPIGSGRLDGEDVSDLWLGSERGRRNDLYWRVSSPKAEAFALRGSWKLHQPRRGAAAELYDLATDPGERVDVADRHPDVVRAMEAALRRWKATLPTTYVGAEKAE